MDVTILLVAMNDERCDILFSNSLCKRIVVVESELLNLIHALDVGVVTTFLKDLISESKFIHPFTITAHDDANGFVLCASDGWFNTCFSKLFCFPLCNTLVNFVLYTYGLIHRCNDTTITYFEVEVHTAFVIITFWIIHFTFPSGFIPFALMFCAKCWSHLHFADFQHCFSSCRHILLLYSY